MFEPCVLGVDPGLAATGLAAVSEAGGRPRVLWSDTVRTPSGLAEPHRLRRLAEAVRDAIRTHGPQAVAVEAVMWGRNKTSALSVSRATGIGNAEKDRVRMTMVRAHRVEGVPEQPDAADAAAVALCHLHQSRIRRAGAVGAP